MLVWKIVKVEIKEESKIHVILPPRDKNYYLKYSPPDYIYAYITLA